MADANWGLAALASPAFSGTPTAPTAAGSTNTTQVATTAFVIGERKVLQRVSAVDSAYCVNVAQLYNECRARQAALANWSK